MKRLLAPFALLLTASVFSAPALAERSGADELSPANTFSGSYLAAETARATNDFEAAVKYYRDALNFDPQNADIQKELLLAYITDGQFDEAVPLAKDLKDAPEIERIARIVLGIDAIAGKRFDEAEKALDLSSQSDLERLLSGIMRSWATYGAGDADAALAEIDQLEGPDWYDLFKAYHGALIAAAAGRNDDAEQMFASGMDNTTGGSASPQTYLRMAENYAGFLAREGKTKEARDIIAQALQASPSNPSLLALKAAKDDELAAKALKIADPAAGSGELLFDIGTAINRDGAESFAALYLELAKRLIPDSASVYFELAGIAERLDLPERAIADYKKIPADSPLKDLAELQTGLNLSDMDRNDEAVAMLTKVVDEHPTEYRAYLALGGVYASQKEYGKAAKLYERAVANLDTNDELYWPLYYRLGIAYERTDQWDKAEPAFNKALELSPDQPDVLNYLGYSWIDMNMHLEKGLDMIQKAVDLRPRDGYIIDSLGWAYYRMGRFEDAVTELEKATDLLSRDPTINDHLGDAYWRVGRKLEATYQWAQALGMDPEPDAAKEIRAKLDASNTAGETPDIASSRADKSEKGQAAVPPEKASDG